MKIKYICPLWGMDKMSLDNALKKIKTAGFDGVEMNAPENKEARKACKTLLNDLELDLVAQQWTGGSHFPHRKSVKEHINSLVTQVENNIELSPLLINSHTGKDYFSFEENSEIINKAMALSEEYNVSIAHETHRGRFNYSLQKTINYLNKFKNLKLVADFSHWCCVSESLLEDQSENLAKVLPHCVHIHARIGYSQGPQVPDPRDPNWTKELELFINWWKQILMHNKKQGADFIAITPEFGPYPYMLKRPFSDELISDQWEINTFMKSILEEKLTD